MRDGFLAGGYQWSDIINEKPERKTRCSHHHSVDRGKKILNYHGLVSTAAILGANIFGILRGIQISSAGVRPPTKELKAKEIAVEEMRAQARSMGANAVVGVDLDYETVGKGTMLMVSASGTAVTVE
jgi:uncharacterized protein YbjQ (UPF0145 family)